MKTKVIFRTILLFICIAALSFGMMAQAAEPVPEITYLPLSRNNQVVDSLNGVNALYNLEGYTKHLCIHLLDRYYETLYGITLNFTYEGPTVNTNNTGNEYWFEQLPEGEAPRTGDVMLGPSYLRGVSYHHWALVKSFDRYTSEVTVFEQNWRSGNWAGVDRILDYPTRYYYFYRLMSADGPVQPDLRAFDRLNYADSQDAVDKASELGIATVADGFQRTITAGELFTMFCNTIRAARGYTIFSDMEDPLDAARKMGLIFDDTWTSEKQVSREVAAILFVRFAELLATQPETDPNVLKLFSDVEKINKGCLPYAARAVSLGLIRCESAAFRPKDGLSIEQALITLVKLAEDASCEVVVQCK